MKKEFSMEREQMLSYILDAYPYPIVFVDCGHVIRYLNRRAEYTIIRNGATGT